MKPKDLTRKAEIKTEKIGSPPIKEIMSAKIIVQAVTEKQNRPGVPESVYEADLHTMLKHYIYGEIIDLLNKYRPWILCVDQDLGREFYEEIHELLGE